METSTASTATATTISTLIIDGIDLELLEHQRQVLITMDLLLVDHVFGTHIAEALSGIFNLLDAWADERDGGGKK